MKCVFSTVLQTSVILFDVNDFCLEFIVKAICKIIHWVVEGIIVFQSERKNREESREGEIDRDRGRGERERERRTERAIHLLATTTAGCLARFKTRTVTRSGTHDAARKTSPTEKKHKLFESKASQLLSTSFAECTVRECL